MYLGCVYLAENQGLLYVMLIRFSSGLSQYWQRGLAILQHEVAIIRSTVWLRRDERCSVHPLTQNVYCARFSWMIYGSISVDMKDEELYVNSVLFCKQCNDGGYCCTWLLAHV